MENAYSISNMTKVLGIFKGFSDGLIELKHQLEVYLFLRRYIERSNKRPIQKS